MIAQQQVTRAEVIVRPTTEPVTLAQAKRQVYLAANDTNYDDELSHIIQVAREQWEYDTDSAVLTQTLRMKASGFGSGAFCLYKRPIQSITSALYYDGAGSQQTLSTDVYSFDSSSRALRLNINQVWPVVELSRWDAVTVTYVAGYSGVDEVPAIVKHAMLLLVGYYFSANRGDNDRLRDMGAYERLVARFLRSSYP